MHPASSRTVIGAMALALAASVAGTGVAAAPDSEVGAQQAARQGDGVERRVNSLLARMTFAEKLQQVQLLSDGQITDADAKAGVGVGLQPDRPGEDQPLPAHRGRAVPAAHPDPLRLRHHPRLPDGLPGAARRGEQLRPRRRAPPTPRSARASRPTVGHQADLQPDGRRLARAALGPDRRGQRRGPVPRLGACRRAGQGRPGQRLQRARQGRHERQALRRLRPARGRPRLQHHRPVRAAAAQPLPAAVQGRDRRRRRHRDVLVQLDQRRPRAARTRTPRPTS